MNCSLFDSYLIMFKLKMAKLKMAKKKMAKLGNLDVTNKKFINHSIRKIIVCKL